MIAEDVMKPLEVRTVQDHMLQFRVASETHPEQEPYEVDLARHDGWGWCSCKHFQTRIQSLFNMGQVPPTDLRCKHLKRCRDYLCDQLIAKIAHMQAAQKRRARFY